jgi:hypothetical protein
MKIMRVSDVDQFNLIFDDLLCFSGMPSEEIYYNMWCVSLEGNLIQSITLEQLKTFLDRLIQNREQQLKCINLSKKSCFLYVV